ncbi:MAG: hypothetical protein H6709_02010 [Kofleriaceae bacterium]|nr:hypothetical protein [Dehalococcoidia bacterium]MCB9570845.1 hypothetical protein [Kofleriaceae bacterium]
MIELPDLRALVALPFDAQSDVLGISNLGRPKNAQRRFDTTGLFWAAPFATGASGTDYAFRLSPGPGHGAVLRCIAGHAVTIASSPDRAFFAIIACERLLRGERSRAMVHEGWSKTSKARTLLREAVTLTGGDPDRLDDAIHLADELPKASKNASSKEIAQRRATLRTIAAEPAKLGEAWARSEASRAAPADTKACLRLVQGNHGLDGTHLSGGLMPGNEHARELLVACAKAVKKSRLHPDPTWKAVVASITRDGHPESEDFIEAIGGSPFTPDSWDALAAVTFWLHAVAEDVPPEHIELAERIADTIARPLLAARRALAGAKGG